MGGCVDLTWPNKLASIPQFRQDLDKCRTDNAEVYLTLEGAILDNYKAYDNDSFRTLLDSLASANVRSVTFSAIIPKRAPFVK